MATLSLQCSTPATPGANGATSTAQPIDRKAKIAAYERALQRAIDARMHILDHRAGGLHRAWYVMELPEPGRFFVYLVVLEQQPEQEDYYRRVFHLICECEEGKRDGMCPHIALVTEDFRNEAPRKAGAV